MYGNRLLIINNGVRQQGQQWGVDHAPELDANTAGRITVVKGAEGVRYGSEALGGVVLMEGQLLPYGQRKLMGKFSGLYGTNGRKFAFTQQLSQGFPLLGGNAAWRVQGTYVNGGRPQHRKLFTQQHWRARNEWFDDLRLAQSSMGNTRILQSVLHRNWSSL